MNRLKYILKVIHKDKLHKSTYNKQKTHTFISERKKMIETKPLGFFTIFMRIVYVSKMLIY